MKIVYFGFDLFEGVFRKICDIAGVELMAVYTFKTDNVFEFNSSIRAQAEKKGVEVYNHKPSGEEIEEYFEKGCDLIVSAGYIHKIPVPNHPQFKGINIHPALLPIGRGAWPYPCTILKGERKTGVTIHKITNRFDEGDILLQRGYSVESIDTLDTLTYKSQLVAEELIVEVLTNFSKLWENAKPQGKGVYWKEPTDADRTITTDMKLSEAQRIVRAFGSYGVIFSGEVFENQTEKVRLVPLADGTLELKY